MNGPQRYCWFREARLQWGQAPQAAHRAGRLERTQASPLELGWNYALEMCHGFLR